jgi:hypothetical protein
MTTERNLVKPNGWATPSQETLNLVNSSYRGGIAERELICMPHYTWCNNVNGHVVEMIAVKERMSGCMGYPIHVVLCVDGKYARKLGLDGKSAEIADYLRGGSFEGIGLLWMSTKR